MLFLSDELGAEPWRYPAMEDHSVLVKFFLLYMDLEEGVALLVVKVEQTEFQVEESGTQQSMGVLVSGR
jgi:hypothetical protein